MFMKPIIGVPILLVNRNSDALCAENIGMSIGKRVRQARKHIGLTQAELAKKVGMKQSTLSELETGESTRTSSVATIANALGVSAYWLDTGLGDMTSQEAVAPPGDESGVDPAEIIRLVSFYGKADARLRREIMSSVEELVRGATVIAARENPNPEQERHQRGMEEKTVHLITVEPVAGQKRKT